LLIVKRSTYSETAPNKETAASLQYLGNEYDELQQFRKKAKQQISQLETRLTEIAEKADKLSSMIDEAQQYSYSYNIKLIGIPELNSKESAIETSQLCIKIFNEMGTNVSIGDIDIAHHVPTRRTFADRPKPIICKFIRRLAREQVMTVRRDVTKINPTCIGLPAESTMHYAGIYDHLTPKQQKLLADTKKFKSDNDYKFCWIKNNTIFLRKTENSQPIMIKEQCNLDTLTS
jgi:hypothetical protein